MGPHHNPIHAALDPREIPRPLKIQTPLQVLLVQVPVRLRRKLLHLSDVHRQSDWVRVWGGRCNDSPKQDERRGVGVGRDAGVCELGGHDDVLSEASREGGSRVLMGDVVLCMCVLEC